MITADKKDIDDNLKQLMDSIITRYLEDYSINPEIRREISWNTPNKNYQLN